ncbi:MAG: SGNH/GDSL hydrolase family protein [Phycisphaeraceae bacterium]
MIDQRVIFKHRSVMRVVLLSVLATFAVQAPALIAQETQPAVAAEPAPKGRDIHWGDLIKPGDRLLFVGDQVTQQMWYTRGFATALLAAMPNDNMRVFNGGMEDATAGSAIDWIDDLVDLTRPQVVFVCLGFNDGKDEKVKDVLETYHNNLATLVAQIKGSQGVREVVLLSPSAVQPGVSPGLDGLNYNSVLEKIAQETRTVAAREKVSFIDVFAYTKVVWEVASNEHGELLTLDGHRPMEEGHMVIASVILRGLGMTPKTFAALGWSPIKGGKMSRVRNALAIEVPPPGLDEAQKSRDLYNLIEKNDELFFRAWRLAGKKPSAGTRPAAMAACDGAWGRVDETARRLYGGSPAPPGK